MIKAVNTCIPYFTLDQQRQPKEISHAEQIGKNIYNWLMEKQLDKTILIVKGEYWC